MPTIKMKQTRPGSNNGLRTELYVSGRTYDVSEELADVFVRQLDCATVVSVRARRAAPENKEAVRDDAEDKRTAELTGEVGIEDLEEQAAVLDNAKQPRHVRKATQKRQPKRVAS